MPKNRLFPASSAPAAAAAAVLAGVLALTGCAPGPKASASPGTKATVTQTTKATEASATTAAPVSGKANIMVYSINSDGPDFEAVVTGAVGDYGPAGTVHPDGTVDPEHTSEMELRLTHGSFRLGIAGLDAKIVNAYHHWPSN